MYINVKTKTYFVAVSYLFEVFLVDFSFSLTEKLHICGEGEG